jgi:hypothetical protein
MNIRIPHEPFNEYVRQGTVGQIIRKILEDSQPEVVYFTEKDGRRGAVMIVDVTSPDRIPSFAEPWFLKFNADCEFRIAMSPEALERAALEKLGETWS